ncbi:MAG: hypothetical protein QM674_18155 [Burkholderiaceae bacterium]
MTAVPRPDLQAGRPERSDYRGASLRADRDVVASRHFLSSMLFKKALRLTLPTWPV